MARVEASVLIPRPVAEVFRVACHYDHDTKWRHGVLELTVTPSGPLEAGSRTREVMTLMGRRLVTEGVVTGFKENTRVDFRSTSGPLDVLNWRIVEAAEGGTKFTYGLEANAKGVMRLLDSLLQRMLQRQVEGDVQRLKELLK